MSKGQRYNYAAEQILHVYRKVKAEQNEAVKKLTIPMRPAYGNWYFQIEDVFQETGPERLKYNYVGYGGVSFLGNINGMVPTQGLYYKTDAIKREIETFIRTMQMISDNKAETVNYIEDQHGRPRPQHCLLWMQA